MADTPESPARVAFDMARYCADLEKNADSVPRNRKAFLDLYAQCRRAATGVAHGAT
jgi:hypothetical protein